MDYIHLVDFSQKEESTMKKYIMELVGTMFLVLMYSMVGNPLAIGAMFAALIYIGVHISGAHFNPAISLAMWLRGKFKMGEMLTYMLFQILGGLLAAAFYWGLTMRTYYPAPAPGVGYWKIFTVEMLFTFFLAFVFLTVFTAKKFKANGMHGLVLGLTLLPIVYLGGTYNPAVSVGPAIFDVFFGGMSYMHVPVYLGGTLLGGGFAALFYRYMYCEEFK
jgi:glycerol uptake facilitator-like aquaporin